MKIPVRGSHVFLESFIAAKAKEVQEVVEAVTQLQHKHVAFHILQQSLSFGRIQYWTRTAPREYISSLLELHHRLQQELLEHLVGQPLSVSQWLQARLPIKWGGLGLLSSRYEVGMRIFHVADLAYLTARHRSHAHVNRMVPGYTPSVARDFEAAARQHLSGFFRLIRKIFITLLSLSINLPSCNSCTRLSTKIFSKGAVWPTKRGFEL